ncbi:hypothetical protein [Labrenzia sp. PHM005]|uniref:hypothetical protein n=1 Tax=Labrenzia sp. PHM005 TaxID=2590016 RepID=UPI0011400B81|nr:hypothetical protein [Labrenzia sp. PHM005]QDG76795.1 hypothetical protein FJ695_13430 [Labrenzia sp. PHM005]
MPNLFLFFLLSLGLGLFSAGRPAAYAQVSPEAEAGWQSDVEGLRHFTGLRCPDVIGAFYRIKVMEGDGSSLAGCIYTGRDGITAVLRMHLQGTGRREAVNFSRSYKAASFEAIQLSGAAASGISFKTGTRGPATQCETLWHFAGAKSDFTLWMAYTLPTQEVDIGPAIASFTDALARQN